MIISPPGESLGVGRGNFSAPQSKRNGDTSKTPSMKNWPAILLIAEMLAVGSLLSACGGGGNGSTGSIGGNKAQTGPYGILNGTSLTSATSHWVSTTCHVQVELTSDKGAYTIVVDRTGRTSAGTATWTIVSDPTSVGIISGGGGLGGFYWVSGLTQITGSVASQSFTAGVSVTTNSTSQSLGTCTFALTPGNLNK